MADDRHYQRIADFLARGQMIPFLGAGANLCDREAHKQQEWELYSDFLPNGAELARYLADTAYYPHRDSAQDLDLLRVSEYVVATDKEAALYSGLREVFDVPSKPTSLHRLLARLAKALDDAGGPQLLVVTTNYDNLMEDALDEKGLAYDVVWYEAKEGDPDRGRFKHRPWRGDPVVVEKPQDYLLEEHDNVVRDDSTGADASAGRSVAGSPGRLAGNPPKPSELPLKRPVVLKLHGCHDRKTPTGDSYVITEDSYIDYLSFACSQETLIPIQLWDRLKNSNLLFLGYSLRDWNLRVILNRVWAQSELKHASWAVQRKPKLAGDEEIEAALAKIREIDLVYCELGTYVDDIGKRLTEALQAAAAARERKAAAAGPATAGVPGGHG